MNNNECFENQLFPLTTETVNELFQDGELLFLVAISKKGEVKPFYPGKEEFPLSNFKICTEQVKEYIPAGSPNPQLTITVSIPNLEDFPDMVDCPPEHYRLCKHEFAYSMRRCGGKPCW